MMKNSILRTGVALACAVSLASCGGGNTGTLYLGGTVTGVTQDGLVLQNNGGSDLAISGTATGTSTFLFKDLVPSDSVYNVTVKSRPANTESCTPTLNKGNTGLYSVTTVVITCVITTHSLKGTVTGLGANTGLVLANGSNQVAVTADGTFEMARVSLGYPYGVTVLQQPTNRTCTVANGVGTIAGDVSNVAVTCVSTGA
jgi:hypothetical protein